MPSPKPELETTAGESQDSRPVMLSPSALAMRWDCSYTSAQRIAERAGISKYFLGEGLNGMVRYVLEEVEAFEASRLSRTGSSDKG